MATESDCAVVMLEAAGVTVMVGVVGPEELELDPPHAAITKQATATGNSAE
jgi:threonine dehydrogenase-like Zn-dependent dehydrogenase